MQHVFDCFCANKLALNAKKTQYMIIQQPGPNQSSPEHDLFINGEKLSRAKSCKFLGITLDENLTFKDHISNINKKISRHLFNIKQIKFTLPKDNLQTLYFALIHPHLTYGILAWGNSKATILRKTETLQKRAIRTINNRKYNSHTDPLFRECGILKISDLFQMDTLLFMHDYINNRLPKSFRGIFRYKGLCDKAYTTRQNDMFDLPMTKSRFVDKLPLYNFPSIWNKNVARFDIHASRNCLKNNIKSTYLLQYDTSVSCSNPYCFDCNSG